MSFVKKYCTVFVVVSMVMSLLLPMQQITVQAQTAGGNLIPNGGFENGIAGWSASVVNDISTQIIETGGIDNSKYVSVTHKQSTQGRYFYNTDKIEIEKNALYQVSVWVKLPQEVIDANYPITIADEGSGLTSADKEYDAKRFCDYQFTSGFTAGEWKQLKGYYRYNGVSDAYSTRFMVMINGADIGAAPLNYGMDDFQLLRCSESADILYDYSQDGVYNPWVSMGSKSTSFVTKLNTVKPDGAQGNVLFFAPQNPNSVISELYYPVELEARPESPQQYLVSYNAKLAAPSSVDLYIQSIITGRGYGNYSTVYGNQVKITDSAWTNIEKVITFNTSSNLFFRMFEKNTESAYIQTDIAKSAPYLISGLRITPIADKNKNNVLKFGEFRTRDSLPSWGGNSTKVWVPNNDGGYVTVTTTGINAISQGLSQAAGQYIKRDVWYRYSVKMKLESLNPTETQSVQMFIFDTADPKYNAGWTDSAYYNTDFFTIKKTDGWVQLTSYLKFSGIEKAPGTCVARGYTDGQPIPYLNGAGTAVTTFAIRCGTGTVISMDDITIEDASLYPNGSMEDINVVKFNNNHNYNGIVAIGQGAQSDSLTQGQLFIGDPIFTYATEAAHSGSYGMLVNGSAKTQNSLSLKQHVNFSTNINKWYKVSAWIKLKDASAAVASLKAINPAANTDPKIHARFLTSWMTYYDRTTADVLKREVGDVGTNYPASVDVTDGAWHNISYVFNPSHFARFKADATAGQYYVPAADFASANMTQLAGYIYPRVCSTNMTFADGTIKSLGNYNDTATSGSGFDYYIDDIKVEEVPANSVKVNVGFDGTLTDEQIKTAVSVSNTTGANQNITIFVVSYDADGTLICVEKAISSTIMKPNKDMDYRYYQGAQDFQIPVAVQPRVGSVRVFVWDDAIGLKPLTEVSELTR